MLFFCPGLISGQRILVQSSSYFSSYCFYMLGTFLHCWYSGRDPGSLPGRRPLCNCSNQRCPSCSLHRLRSGHRHAGPSPGVPGARHLHLQDGKSFRASSGRVSPQDPGGGGRPAGHPTRSVQRPGAEASHRGGYLLRPLGYCGPRPEGQDRRLVGDWNINQRHLFPLPW